MEEGALSRNGGLPYDIDVFVWRLIMMQHRKKILMCLFLFCLLTNMCYKTNAPPKI